MEIFSRHHLVVFRQPQLTEEIYLKQFHPLLWVAVAVSLAILGALLFCATRATKNSRRDSFGWLESIEWIFCKL